ncbi:hypothetical protein NGM33_28490 [Nocardiopsis dassonvillei]|uniref:hypothetical protein n=1 Tax=Nocardiopsis dassonvillei TaxID=2014 RepID=UPI0020A453F8|nr:hypothetical protein [Nocardiopsis dassonvillei]MCP3017275.1 hypothetical protein [Nocardiopsis dassonvillei]
MICETKTMPGSDLVSAVREVNRLEEQFKQAKERLDVSIVDALAEGWRVVDVMEVTGLSRERIRQIRNRVENDRARASLQRRAEAGEAPPPF